MVSWRGAAVPISLAYRKDQAIWEICRCAEVEQVEAAVGRYTVDGLTYPKVLVEGMIPFPVLGGPVVRRRRLSGGHDPGEEGAIDAGCGNASLLSIIDPLPNSLAFAALVACKCGSIGEHQYLKSDDKLLNYYPITNP